MSAPRSKLTSADAQTLADLAEAWTETALLAERAFFSEAKSILSDQAAVKREEFRRLLVQLTKSGRRS